MFNSHRKKACSVHDQSLPLIPLEEPAQKRSRTTTSSHGQYERKRTERVQIYGDGIRLQSPKPQNFPIEGDLDEDELQHDESIEHIIMAVDQAGDGATGCAYYVPQEELLLCMEQIQAGDGDTTQDLTNQIEPTILLIPPRARISDIEQDLSSASRTGSLVNHDENKDFLPYELILRPPSDFDYNDALKSLAQLQDSEDMSRQIRLMVPCSAADPNQYTGVGEVEMTCKTDNLLRIASFLDLENRLSIGCAGAILRYLKRRRTSEYLRDDPAAANAYAVSHLDMFTMRNTMYLIRHLSRVQAKVLRFIDANTLASLQIIQPDFHPNAAKQGPGNSSAKESLSVYGLFYRFARTTLGRTKLRKLFLRPSLDVEVIDNRLNVISVCTAPENQQTAAKLSESLGRTKNLKPLLLNLRKGIENTSKIPGKIKSGVWTEILQFCYHSIDIINEMADLKGCKSLPLYHKGNDVLRQHELQKIGKMIYDVVDLEESAIHNRTVIKRNINEDLDRVKDVHDSMEDTLSQVARDITNEMPQQRSIPLSVTFLPQLGFYVTVPTDISNGEPIYRGRHNDWEQIFRTDKLCYMKNDRMRELDHQIGDLWAVIRDAEIEISHALAQNILDYERQLIAGSDFCGELDCLLALAQGAIQYNLVRPKIVAENVIDIKGGRHILQERVVETFIPNDTLLARGLDAVAAAVPMMILTGPNYSGKSVYQKQVALVVYMAQIGSFVPAETAVLGITDKILTRIATRETVSKVQSAFMVDLQQIARIFNRCTSKSLIVIDEFGKGTDTCDGAGLAYALVDHFLTMGNDLPKILVSTHFHEIFEDGLFESSDKAVIANMNVIVSSDNQPIYDERNCQVTYLYDLNIGKSTISYGSQCAAMNGIPEKVTQRAAELNDFAVRGEDLVAACAILSHSELAELEKAERVARDFLAMDLDQDSIVKDVSNTVVAKV